MERKRRCRRKVPKYVDTLANGQFVFFSKGCWSETKPSENVATLTKKIFCNSLMFLSLWRWVIVLANPLVILQKRGLHLDYSTWRFPSSLRREIRQGSQAFEREKNKIISPSTKNLSLPRSISLLPQPRTFALAFFSPGIERKEGEEKKAEETLKKKKKKGKIVSLARLGLLLSLLLELLLTAAAASPHLQ